MNLESTDVAIARIQERLDSLPCEQHNLSNETVMRLETKLDSLGDTVSGVCGKVDRIHNKLFIGNGDVPLFTKVDHHDRVISDIKKVVGVIVAATATAVVSGVIYILRGGQ